MATQSVILSGTMPEIQRSTLVKEWKEYVVPWVDFRIWDDFNTVLTDTAGTDDLALIGGTWTSASPHIASSDASAASITQYTRFQVCLPPEYDDGQGVRIRIRAKVDVLAGTTNTLDVVAYESTLEAGIGSDLCATAAQTLTTSYANYDFVLTPTGLVAGDLLDIRIAVALNDTGEAHAAIARLGAVKLRCEVRG